MQELARVILFDFFWGGGQNELFEAGFYFSQKNPPGGGSPGVLKRSLF